MMLQEVQLKERLLRNALVKYNNVLADNDYSCVIKRENDVKVGSVIVRSSSMIMDLNLMMVISRTVT